ncbi:MAG: hypothetical protein J6T25_00965 [Bacilli bacterium]|nr:hypothetical protein [Bacilli bacterium]
MKNKTKFTFLTLVLAAGLIISACGKTPSGQSQSSINQNSDSSMPESTSSAQESTSSAQQSTSSSQQSTSSSQATNKCTVNFVVDGQVVQSSQVEKGEVAEYRGATPSKASSGSTVYRFKGWDKDITQPINADTTFNAVFEETEYANEIVVDDFESYKNTGRMKEAGWKALTYTNAAGWTTETNAEVLLSSNAAEGQKALRFNAWENAGDYKFAKDFADGSITKSANAIKFNLMVPSMNLVKILVYAKATILGQERVADFKYTLGVTSNEYVEYTIPIADEGWGMYGEAGKTFPVVADYIGIHQDDIVKHITKIEFYIKGDDGIGGQPYAAFFDSFKFVTLDNPQREFKQNISLRDRYTGITSSGNTVRFDIGENGAATARVLDLETPMVVSGSYSRDGETLTFRSSDNGTTLVYTGTITDNGKIINYASASGSLKNEVEDMKLNAVQVVDDFEQYSESGTAYSQKNTDATQISGARGAFYSEHYTGEGSSDWGKSGWQLLPEGDEINLIEDEAGAHSGKKYLSLKHFSGKAARYMPWGLANDLGEKNCFRGSKFSFWAKGFVNKLTITAVSHSNPTPSSISGTSGYFKKQEFNFGKNLNEWQHVEVELNPKLVYYGFIIMIEKDYLGDAELFIDDIEFYSANPYAKYVVPLPPEPKHFDAADCYLAKLNGLLPIQLSFDRNNTAHYIAPNYATMVNGTYVIDEDDVTLTFGETTYVATIADDYSKLTFKSVNGSDTVAQNLNGLSFDRVDFAETGEKYADVGQMYYDGFTDENGVSGARGAYYCDRWLGSGSTPLGGNGWGLMGGNGDQIGLEQGGPVGYQYPTFKRSGSADLRYIQWELYKGTAKERKGVNSFNVWLKNPADNEMSIKLYVFKNKQLNPSNQQDRVELPITIPANQDWTLYTVQLNPEASYYGFGLYTYKGATNAYLGLDGAYFCGVDDNPNYAYYTKNNMVLSGSTLAGEASIKFGTAGKAYLTCSAANINNQQVSYTMDIGSTGQEMIITMGENTLKGLYQVDTSTFKASFTVTEATGQFAALVAANTVFSD